LRYLPRRSLADEEYLIKVILYVSKRVLHKKVTQNKSHLEDNEGGSQLNHSRSISNVAGLQDKFNDSRQFDRGNNGHSSSRLQSHRLNSSLPQVEFSNVMVTQEFVFVFRYDEVFTFQELKSKEMGDLKYVKKLLAQVIKKRLKIREIPDILAVDQQLSID